MAAVQHLVARPGIAAREQTDKLVGAGAADDAFGIETEMGGDGMAQLGRGAVGIPENLVCDIAIGGNSLWTGAERALVRGKTDDALRAGDLGFAADIRRDVENARRAARVPLELR